jgi:hypothetical protein
MTQMSDPHAEIRASAASNCSSRHGGSPLARPLHGVWQLRALLMSVMLVGCIIPPSLSVDQQDAGIDSPPSITSVRSDNQDLPEPGPVLFQLGANTTMNLTLLDTDLQDPLYVRVFVDYTITAPTPARSTCIGTSNNTAERTATCELKGLCQPSDVGQTRLMRIVVFDREPLDTGTPVFMAIPAGGESTSRTYQLKCTS